jgi:ubiquinone/menaquinone biosynthesis C-methylase UbiE
MAAERRAGQGTGTSSADRARLRRIWQRYAPRYDREMRFWDRVAFGERREWVCSQAVGRVLEVAVGTGLNLPRYPPGAAVTGLDLSRPMLAVARERAVEIGRPVALVEGDAQALPFADRTFDTVVCTLGLCSVPDDRAAIAEMYRVLRPGGRLLLLDHVEASNIAVRAVQRLLEPVALRTGADHLTRRPLSLVQQAGFTIADTGRARAGMVEWLSAVRPVAGSRPEG